MSYQCDNCQSLFFKTLETRVSGENLAILYKKRCKRCKYKYLVRKTIPHGQIALATHQEWLGAVKVNLPPAAGICERPKIMVGEYTQRISKPADEMMPYLRQIRRAEQGGSL
jgi:DNA-directed RNA polymerase subunit RPC12/RpoP